MASKFPKRKCERCGLTFPVRRKWARFCSQDCQLKAYNEKHGIKGKLQAKRDAAKRSSS